MVRWTLVSLGLGVRALCLARHKVRPGEFPAQWLSPKKNTRRCSELITSGSNPCGLTATFDVSRNTTTQWLKRKLHSHS